MPVGYTLTSYIKVLDELEDKKVIRSYKDFSDNDKFNFVVIMDSKELKVLSDSELLDKLKLIKRVAENYTSIDEDNKIRQFSSPKDILEAFIKIRLKFIEARKVNMIEK